MMPKTVAEYLADGCGRCPLGGTDACKVHFWPQELRELRRIVLECGLNEEIKWGVPCYVFDNSNILIVSAFKEYAALSFFKGALLQDAEALMVKPGENSQAARLFQFTDVRDILAKESILKAYIFEAIEVEKAGLKVPMPAKDALELPEELELFFAENSDLKAAFEALTPGRQRGYVLHFSAPKQASTRISRIEKCIPKILEGKGFHDR